MSRDKISIRIRGRVAPAMEGSVIGGRYAFQKELGRGGVGEVFLARDLQLERMVAVKRVYIEMGEGTQRTAFAIGEARKLALLQHPNIVTVYDVLQHNGDVHMVMEYLSGLTLDDLEAPLTLDDFINVARQTLGGLAAAHALGMIHLDIKSTNIMLTWLATGQMQVKLLDFGLATMLEQAVRDGEDDGSVFGSVYTMAPEQLERRPVDVRTDLYSLGCVFYHALTRKDPFRGPTVEAIIDAHLDHDVKPLASRRPDLPESVISWVETMMSRDPEHRPESAATALKLLLSSLAGSPVTTVRAASRGRSERFEIHLPDQEALAGALGREVVVNGEVERVGENMPGTIRFLNFKTVQHNDFAVILPLRNGHAEFARDRLNALVGKTIRVTGKITDFHGSPQMVVDSPAQIALAEEAEALPGGSGRV